MPSQTALLTQTVCVCACVYLFLLLIFLFSRFLFSLSNFLRIIHFFSFTCYVNLDISSYLSLSTFFKKLICDLSISSWFRFFSYSPPHCFFFFFVLVSVFRSFLFIYTSPTKLYYCLSLCSPSSSCYFFPFLFYSLFPFFILFFFQFLFVFHLLFLILPVYNTYFHFGFPRP